MPEMLAVDLYGIVNCDSVKRARQWLDDAKVVYVFHDFKKHPPSHELIGLWLTRVPWEHLVNRRGTSWRQMPEDQRPTDLISAQRAMVRLPSLIKRPVMTRGTAIMVGFDALHYRAFLS